MTWSIDRAHEIIVVVGSDEFLSRDGRFTNMVVPLIFTFSNFALINFYFQ